MREEIDRRGMAALSSGHLATDFANGALPALIPFLVVEFDLTYTLAATIMLASTVSSSVVQPAFGLWSDRRGAAWLLPSGVAVTGAGIALAAVSPSYGIVLLFVVLSGLGSAAYHPEASKFAALVSGRRRASGMSLFSIGGNMGYALGAATVTPLVLVLGLGGGLLVALPCLAAAVMLVAVLPYLKRFVPSREHLLAGGGAEQRGALGLLLGVIAFRSLSWFGLLTFVPLWEVSLGRSEAYGNALLTLMLFAGGVGTLVAGPLADRYGTRAVLLVSVVAQAPLILCFVMVGGIPGAIALAFVGVCVIGTYGVTIVMSQQYLPGHVGLASGLTIGMSVGLGGVAAVGLGALADAIDLQAALYVCGAAPLAAVVLTMLLPTTRDRRAIAPEPVVP